MGKRDYGLSSGLVVLGKASGKTSNREVGYVNLESYSGAGHKSSVWNGLHTSGGREYNTGYHHFGRIAGELTFMNVPGAGSLRDG